MNSVSEAVGQELRANEAVQLGAVDPRFYTRFFFPRAFRQVSPEFHVDIWTALNDRDNRFVAIEVFRGGAKTTLLRAFTSRRIAYGMSRTILFVSATQGHAVRSVEWVKRAIMTNPTWSTVFGLKIGAKESAEELEIINEADGSKIRIIALGITGQTRGINIEDYRPDLIVVDDPCDEQNTGTPEQRKKISDLFFGALAKSLAPISECPDAKMVLLQTPLNSEDLVESCLRDPQWVSLRFGCFDHEGESRWPERWTTEQLMEDKKAHIARNQTSLWLREMECLIVSDETASFRHEWLEYHDEVMIPKGGINVMAIDPVPPPSEASLRKGLVDKDWEVIQVWKHIVVGGKAMRYLCERTANRGHDPEWTIAEVFRLGLKWRPFKIGVEAVAYQRTLLWILEKAQRERKTYFTILPVDDRRNKRVRIEQAFSDLGSNHAVSVPATASPFIEQWDAYPDINHDDELDCGAIANKLLDDIGFIGDVEFEEIVDDLPALTQSRGAP